MTGGGTATVAHTTEPGLLEDPTDPTYYQVGKDISISDLSLTNELERVRDPDDPQPIESVAQNLEGALNISWTLTDDNWHGLVFNDSGTTFQKGRPVFSRWWIGVDYLDGIAERVLKGAIVTQVDIEYQQGGKMQISMNLIYADEELNTAITPTAIEKSTDVKMWHDLDLTITNVTDVDCEKLQSLTLSIDTGARFQRGGSRKACDAVIGTVDTSLTTDAIFTQASVDRLELAYGSTGSTSPGESIDAVDGTLSIMNTDYSLTGVKPNTESWGDVVDPKSDTQDNTEFHVSGVEVVA
jgi:molybdopterin-binding protein